MKAWQKGIELDTLLDMEKIWLTYNNQTSSPFLEMKKNSIASVIDQNLYDYTNDYKKPQPKTLCHEYDIVNDTLFLIDRGRKVNFLKISK